MARSRLLDGWSVMSRPSSISGRRRCLSPAISRSSVDLPQPEGPTKTMNSPWLMGEVDAFDGAVFAKEFFDAAQLEGRPPS